MQDVGVMCELLELYVVLFEVRNIFSGCWGYVCTIGVTCHTFSSKEHIFRMLGLCVNFWSYMLYFLK